MELRGPFHSVHVKRRSSAFDLLTYIVAAIDGCREA